MRFNSFAQNTKNFLGLLSILFILLLSNSISDAFAAQLQSSTDGAMLDIPISDELYRDFFDFVDRMVAKGCITKLFKNTQPYSRGEVAKVLRKLDKKVKEGSLKLSKVEEQRLRQILLFSQGGTKGGHLFQTQSELHKFSVDFGLGEDVISREKRGYATLFRPTVEGQIKDNFVFRTDLKVYLLSPTQFSDIPKTEVRMAQMEKETKTASLSNYYIKTKLPWFSLFFGHDNLHWGPGRHGALLISKEPLPMDMLKVTALYYPVKFQAVTAKLGSDIDDKYLSGHRLELNLWDRLHLGIAETIVYGHRFETVYLNPVQFYTTTEFIIPETGGENDNVLISGDFDIVPVKDLEIYGEVMIDDYQLYKPKSLGTRFGILFGGYWVDPFWIPDTDLRVEYAFVNQGTYTHSTEINAYTHYDTPIGHQIGADADNLWLKIKHYLTANLAVSLSYELERHGQKIKDSEWEFLSGVTESKHSFGLSASYNMIGKYSANLEYTRSWFRNKSNQAGESSTKDQYLLSGQYRF